MDTFFALRPCNPRIQSIRQATVDLLSEGSGLTPVNISISRPFLATRLQARSSGLQCLDPASFTMQK